MQIKEIKTTVFKEGNLKDFIVKFVKLKEKAILCISSKILAVSQGRVVDCKDDKVFKKLIKKEADKLYKGNPASLTIKNGLFIPNSGIDESNISKGKVVLMPTNPWKAAHKLHSELKKHFKLKNLGIIIVDSTCMPLRQGTIGVALGYAGIEGVENKIGTKDIYGNKLKMTKINIADSLATTANLVMGEGNEKTPLVIIQNTKAKYTNKKQTSVKIKMNPKKDIFKALY